MTHKLIVVFVECTFTHNHFRFHISVYFVNPNISFPNQTSPANTDALTATPEIHNNIIKLLFSSK